MGIDIIGDLLGGGSSPSVSTAPAEQTQDAKKSAKSARAALYETSGGVTGAELDPDQVSKRRTLLGN